MEPEEIIVALNVIEAAIGQEPAIAADIKALFSGGTPSTADWAKLRANISVESYGMFVPDSSLPAGS